MSEKKHLYNLLRNLVEQDFNRARTNLQLVVEAKMKNRINKSKEASKKTITKKNQDDDKKLSKMNMKGRKRKTSSKEK